MLEMIYYSQTVIYYSSNQFNKLKTKCNQTKNKKTIINYLCKTLKGLLGQLTQPIIMWSITKSHSVLRVYNSFLRVTEYGQS